jgi:hypothetical protein
MLTFDVHCSFPIAHQPTRGYDSYSLFALEVEVEILVTRLDLMFWILDFLR